MNKQKRIFLILGVLVTLGLAIVAVITAIRLQQIGTEPVAPSVPKSKPKAGGEQLCIKTWTIGEGPTATPTPLPTTVPGGLTCHFQTHQGKEAYRNNPANEPGFYYLTSRIQSGGTVSPGEIIVFAVYVKNSGGTAVSGSITDSLNPLFDYMDGEQGCSFNTLKRIVTCSTGSINPGASIKKAFRVRVLADARIGAENVASVLRSGFIVPDDTCAVTLALVVPTPTPTITPKPTKTPTPTTTPTTVPGATNTPVPTATNTPVPGTPGQPTNTPVPIAKSPTAIPTVSQQSLPTAGGIGQTIGVVIGGIGVLLLGLLMLL